ncbi:non-homologous end-joining DNA ligase [Bryobacter aggregatus]|uniref:non-homologous end-joining DNA ligase n=1 Tax=Bryobacter aggregatus TaxID=360054 RepID=UPI000ADB1320|nr:non-homologous end-joining DNA ligase [Bryobacter aggregatus]
MPVRTAAAKAPLSRSASTRAPKLSTAPKRPIVIPRSGDAIVTVNGKAVSLTNLAKVFWPAEGIQKADLLQYYADISPYLLPYLESRAMVLKRYPNGAFDDFFFQKHAPASRPDWLPICKIQHGATNLVAFPVIDDLAGLLWAVNLGCIDLNPWYAQCDDVDRPDSLHFDLDPTSGADFALVRQAALLLREELDAQKMKSYPKTTGSRGIHIYVPIERGPLQKQVWTVAKAFAVRLAAKYPDILESEYRIAKRKEKRVLVDYNQNAWGRTLASVYSVRPKPRATVSAPVTWDEVEQGIEIEDFRIDNMVARVAKLGDLFRPLLLQKSRVKLGVD